MKKILKIKNILLILLMVLLVMQFFKPQFNSGNAFGPDDIQHYTAVPSQVTQILEKACYDCHSDHTNYPWYSTIQPVGWWLAHHVEEGKRELNFSKFLTYKPKRRKHKMEELIEMIKTDEMPLKSYTVLHPASELSPKEKELLLRFAESVQNSIVIEK